MSQPTPGKRRTVRGYAFALAGVVVLGAAYFWANTGPAGGARDGRLPASSAAVPADSAPAR